MENYTVHVQVHLSCLQVKLSLIHESCWLISQKNVCVYIYVFIYFILLFEISLYNLNCIVCELDSSFGE
jgi:hypothetical protein